MMNMCITSLFYRTSFLKLIYAVEISRFLSVFLFSFRSICVVNTDRIMIAGYCVEGTLAKQILSEPEEITAMNGQKLPLKMSVDYISFSAHTDYKQTSEFINILRPPNVVRILFGNNNY